MKHDIMLMSLYSNMTDDEIKDVIQKMMPICLSNKCGFCLTISGYDNDPRDLWKIPEAVSFMKRLVDIGLISGLEVSTTSKELIRPEYKGIEELPGFGALEIWLAGTGKMDNARIEITTDYMLEFFEVLGDANAKSRKICSEPPYNTNMGAKVLSTIQDGAVRHCPRWNK